jgi:seryl-tRNA synthetase
VPAPLSADEERFAFRARLLDAGLLIDTGVAGLYGRSPRYESVVDALDAFVTREAVTPPVEVVHFPPILARWVFERTDYLKSFPDLMGSVHTFRGGDRQHAELLRLADAQGDWSRELVPADVVLCPATCHPLYPLCSGTLTAGGRWFEVHGYCFRCEPAVDPARMQAFRMHEHVYVGEPDVASAHRDRGLERGLELLSGLGLSVQAVPANDPFFGRAGGLLAASQLEEGLKMEIVTPICSQETPTAILSANCHRDHFGVAFGIHTADGDPAHSACVGFGTDRVALALLHVHGLDPGTWPAPVRVRLWP